MAEGQCKVEAENTDKHVMGDETIVKRGQSVRSDYEVVQSPQDNHRSVYHSSSREEDALYAESFGCQRNSVLTHEFENAELRTAKRSKRKTYISKCTLFILVSMLIISCVMSIGSFVIMLRTLTRCDDLERKISSLSSTHASYASAQHDALMCLPCDELMLGPFDEDNEELKTLIQTKENNAQTCCAKTSQQLSTLLGLFTRKKELAKCDTGSLNSSSTRSCNTTTGIVPLPIPLNAALSKTETDPRSAVISAHMHVGEQPASAGEEVELKNWLFGRPGTHLEGLNITENRIVVPESGVYFLYSQVGFLVFYDTQENIAKSSEILFHKVLRFNHIYPLFGKQELLRSEVTQCWDHSKEYGRYTSYVGAAINLTKGDQIFVQVSRISLLSRDNNLSYFGLYKIH